MAEQRSKRINLSDDEKLKQVNPDTLKLMKKYEADMALRELSPKTVYGYKQDLKQWFIWILENQENQCVIDLNDDDIQDFLFFCKQEGNHTERMKRRMATMSAFYKFLRKRKLITENPMEFLDRPKKGTAIVVQTYLTPDQVELMKAKLNECGDLQLKAYALFSLSTMARVNAIANLKWKQIDFEARECKDVLEKEGYIVELSFSQEVKELLMDLKKYREDKCINDYGWVFYSKYNTETKPISNGTLLEWCKKIGGMIDVPTLHPHDFRHSGATLLKNMGMSLEDISELLHHQGTDVTSKFYIKKDTSKIKAMKDNFGF